MQSPALTCAPAINTRKQPMRNLFFTGLSFRLVRSANVELTTVCKSLPTLPERANACQVGGSRYENQQQVGEEKTEVHSPLQNVCAPSAERQYRRGQSEHEHH